MLYKIYLTQTNPMSSIIVMNLKQASNDKNTKMASLMEVISWFMVQT